MSAATTTARATPAGAAPAGTAATRATPDCTTPLCTHSIVRRLSGKLALFTMAVLALLSVSSWSAVKMMILERNTEDTVARCELISTIVALESRAGGEDAVLQRLRSDASMRGGTRLVVWRADGSLLWEDPMPEVLVRSEHMQVRDFRIPTPELAGGELRARYAVDFTRDARMGTRWAWTLILVTLAAGAAVAAGAAWHVRRQLRPLADLAEQTRGISPQRLDQRLALADPAEELRPFIDQFNALMQRLERSYAQLEGFNADVAHELRTPLANLIGQTEVVLARERPVAELRETLVSNLEELQRLAAMVNDMLFLSQADRGAIARRGRAVALAELAAQVVDFHEAPLEEAGVTLRIEGEASLPVDEALVKRALSNLIGNATRFAERGTAIVVHIEGGPPDLVRVTVSNRGDGIPADALPRLFDRFYRGDASRYCCDTQHHGLGLAIVAAIARMHGGEPFAESADGHTRIGFTLAAA